MEVVRDRRQRYQEEDEVLPRCIRTHELGEKFKLRSEWDFLAVGLHCLVALHLK